MTKRTVDVVIPTYRPGARFAALLELLAAQTWQVHGIYIINTEEANWTDAADEAVRKLNVGAESALSGRITVKHIPKSEFDHAATRAYGARLSDADAFLCMTDDAVPNDCYLVERLMRALYEGGAGMPKTGTEIAAAYARQLPNPDCGEAERYTRSFNYPETSRVKTAADLGQLGIKTYFMSNVCCLYDKVIYERLGGFTAHAVFNEDMLYAAKAIQSGYAVAYAADACVLHSHNYGAMQQLHRNFDLGVSQAMHPEVFDGIRAEGEGLRLVKETAAHLLRTGNGKYLPGLFVQSAFKYAGFRLGRAYRKLPYRMTEALAMNKDYMRKHLRDV